MSQVLSAWQATTRLPGGRWLFSFLFSRKTPYAATIRPRFVRVEPHRVELVVPHRRGVRNHLGTIHATALCTGLETAAGTLAEATVPRHKRWIPRGMEVSYTAKADGTVRCVAWSDQVSWDDDQAFPVQVRGELADGTTVIEGVIDIWVTARS